MSWNFIGESIDKNNFSLKLFLNNTQLLKPHDAFVNGSSANIKLSKTQLHTIGHSGGFLGRSLKALLKTELSLICNLKHQMQLFIQKCLDQV